MNPDDPRHGTPQQTLRYILAGCACEYCERNRAHIRRRTKLKRMGRAPRLDAAPIRKHIAELLDAGWNQQNIAKAAGVGTVTVSDLRRGKAKSVTPRVAAALLALKGKKAEAPWIPSAGTVRRLEALQAIGWPMRQVCARAGLTPRYGNQLIYTKQQMVDVDAARRIAKVYDELSMVRPVGAVANHARVIAQRNGAAPPLAWDDIDDPAAVPDLGEIKHDKRGRPMVRDRIIEDAQWLADADETLTSVLSRLGMNAEHLYQTCRRADRLDLYATLSRREPAGDRAHDMRNLKAGAA